MLRGEYLLRAGHCAVTGMLQGSYCRTFPSLKFLDRETEARVYTAGKVQGRELARVEAWTKLQSLSSLQGGRASGSRRPGGPASGLSQLGRNVGF